MQIPFGGFNFQFDSILILDVSLLFMRHSLREVPHNKVTVSGKVASHFSDSWAPIGIDLWIGGSKIITMLMMI